VLSLKGAFSAYVENTISGEINKVVSLKKVLSTIVETSKTA
jgi:hypothetical protein